MALFSKSIGTILKNEGGFSNVTGDSGGMTKFGISSNQYPNIDIKNLTLTEAKNIYKRDYWDKNLLIRLNNQSVATLALDMLVLHGQGAKLIQRAVNDSGGSTFPNNKIGPDTINNMNRVEPTRFINNLIKRRVEYMKEIVRKNPVNQKFLPGWLKRAYSFSEKSVNSFSLKSFIFITILTFFVWPKGKAK